MYMYCTMFKNSGKDQEIHFYIYKPRWFLTIETKLTLFPSKLYWKSKLRLLPIGPPRLDLF